MKTPEEMAAYFKSMPSKKKANPYWKFDKKLPGISALAGGVDVPFGLQESKLLLIKIRELFRRYYESFHSEAQVLCVTKEDHQKLVDIGVPMLAAGNIGPFGVQVAVLPQDNHMGTSVISERFWQERIIGMGITPVCRIHSHHILDPYQSITDYSTLNSGTLEMVIGKIFEDGLNICYWLDVPGTDTKAQTFLAKEKGDGTFAVRPYVFHGSGEHTDTNK